MKHTEKVIRVSGEVYDRLREKKQKSTFSSTIAGCLDAAEALSTGDTIFRAGQEYFTDVAVARGHSIVVSAKNQQPIEWPDIYVAIGKADPDAE